MFAVDVLSLDLVRGTEFSTASACERSHVFFSVF